MAAIFRSRQTFLPDVIPEVEYTRKIAVSISDISSFWSTFKLTYWRRYINLKFWPTLWPCDVINDVMNTRLYKCSPYLLVPMHRKFNDDIFACFSVITKNVVIPFRPPCDVIGDVIIMTNTFYGTIWDDLFISEVILKLCLIFKNFQNDRHFELATNFFSGSDTRSWIYQKDSH